MKLWDGRNRLDRWGRGPGPCKDHVVSVAFARACCPLLPQPPPRQCLKYAAARDD
jgi:hypothetical protein